MFYSFASFCCDVCFVSAKKRELGFNVIGFCVYLRNLVCDIRAVCLNVLLCKTTD